MTAQLENGYTKIANELMEAIPLYKFNGTQLRVLLVILRYTYGFSRKEHDLSLSFISAATGTHKEQIKRELKTLIDKKVITVIQEASFKTSRILAFNKDYEQWGIPKNIQEADSLPVSGKDTHTGSGLVSSPGSELAPQERKTKENIKEKGSSDTPETPYQKIVDLYHEICPSYPKVVIISANRKTHMKARWEQYKKSLDVFINLFRKAEASAFMKGSNDRHWKADLDWMMNETNMAKVLEGKYDRENGRASPGSANKETPEEALARISRELEAEKIGSEAGGYDNSENSSNIPYV